LRGTRIRVQSQPTMATSHSVCAWRPRRQRRPWLRWHQGIMGTVSLVSATIFIASRWQEVAFLDQRPWQSGPPTPAEVRNKLPLPHLLRRFVNTSRAQVVDVLTGEDDRLLVIVGPCSIHDPSAAHDYAYRLQQVSLLLRESLFILMRVYLEKPRTSVGWRGLVNDPELSGSDDMERGVALGRRVLLDVNAAGLPAATEFLDPLVAPYIEDLVSWGSIGARTVESPQHRALAAGLSMPVGFKNTRSGDIQSAVNAVVAAAAPQRKLAMDDNGRLQLVAAAGNANGHVILRGGENGPNYDNASVAEAADRLSQAGFRGARVVVDCSHGNSGKRVEGELEACRSVAGQVSAGNTAIGGVMIESFLEAGSQRLEPGVTARSSLKYGCSVTDPCLDFAATEALLRELAAAVEARRSKAMSWREAVEAQDR